MDATALATAAGARKYLWNPREVLEIESLGPGFTCIGKEVAKGGSRCISPLEKRDCDLAEDLLDEITTINMAEKRHMTHQLQRLASLLLCHGHHQYQAAEKAREWIVKIREHGQELKEGSDEIASSDIQAMNTELGQVKTQLALIAVKYFSLREKHAAVLYENETLRKDRIKLKDDNDSIINKLKAANEQTGLRYSQRLFEVEESLRHAKINLTEQAPCRKAQRVKQGVSRHEDFDTLKTEIPVDERQIVLSESSSVFSEWSKHSSKFQYAMKDLSVLTHAIVSIFIDDRRLQPLFSSALKNPGITVTQFERSFCQFLTNFAKDWGDEVQGAGQGEIALVIRIFADDFATAISSRFRDEETYVPECIQQGQLQRADSVKLLMLSHFFESRRARTTRSHLGLIGNPDLGGSPDQTTSATEVDRCQKSGFRDLADEFSKFILPWTESKQLIVRSKAFDTLQQQLDRFVHRDHGVPVDSFTSAVSYAVDNNRVVKFTPWTMTTRPGYADQIKRTLEKWVRSPVIWWPLQPPKTSCLSGYIRISWACGCGSDLSVDAPEEVAREYQQKCSSSSNNQPILPLHNDSTHIANLNRTSTQTTLTTLDGGLFHRSSQQPALTSDTNTAADTKSSLQSDRYVHWCVDANRYETELNHISIPTLDDSNFISKLKHAYRTTRGIRQWFSLTDCYGVRFVTFERINRSRDLIACGKEDLPCSKTNKDYVYYYRDPREQFIKTLEQSLIHGFHNPRSCTAQNMEDIITRIPKKTNGRLKQEYGALGYGMHAVPGWAVWKLMLALVMSQAGPSVFVVKWLCGHSGDLQNAFSLSMYLIALLNLVVIIPDVWSLQK